MGKVEERASVMTDDQMGEAVVEGLATVDDWVTPEWLTSALVMAMNRLAADSLREFLQWRAHPRPHLPDSDPPAQ